MIAVETHDLRHVYPVSGKNSEIYAIKGITLLIMKGEIFGFLGPNGSGKTTLFKILSTLIAPSHGSACIFDNDLRTNPQGARKHLGVVFQHPGLDVKLTVEENLRHHGEIYGMSGKTLSSAIDSKLERFGLAARRGELVGKLSGGLKRRVELAKGLLHSPELLVLDEPSTGLDPAARRDLWDTLLSLKKNEGLTVLVTTHLGEEAEKCDQLAIMSEGRIVATGSPEKLKAGIGGDVITVQTDSPKELAEAIRLKFGAKTAVVEGTVRMEMRDGHEFIPKLVEAFPGQVKAVNLGKPALEDVFLLHTGKILSDSGDNGGN